MSHPADEVDSPTVEPLRIFKPQSPKPAAGQGLGSFQVPSAHVSRLVLQADLPPTAGSFQLRESAPVPRDEDHRIAQPAKESRPSYADDDDHQSSSSSTRAHASPAGQQTPGDYNDTFPRLSLSPVEKKPGLAERRGTAPQALSPTSPQDDPDELFAKPVAPEKRIPINYQKKTYYPPPASESLSSNAGRANGGSDRLNMPEESSVNRFPSTASTSTTRASRGSPPPPETPIVEPGNIPGGGIEARYAASGISGTATLTSLQAQSAAASQRLAQYGGQPPLPQPVARPWTPTESPDQHPHGPATVYQGANPVPNSAAPSANRPPRPAGSSSEPSLQVSVLEQDFQRMQASTPPPAYTSVNPSANSS